MGGAFECLHQLCRLVQLTHDDRERETHDQAHQDGDDLPHTGVDGLRRPDRGLPQAEELVRLGLRRGTPRNQGPPTALSRSFLRKF